MNPSPQVVQGLVSILEQKSLARDTYLLRLEAPLIGQMIRPGQFVMLRLLGGNDPLLARPFALYDTVLDDQGRVIGIDIVYLVVGKATSRLAQLRAGDTVEIWGPLGNGFPEPAGPHVVLVAGGIGQTPFLAHVRELLGGRGYAGAAVRRRAESVRLCYGVRTQAYAAGVEQFLAAGAEVLLASNDGTIGHHGFVTDLLETLPRPDHVFGCGPEPMLRELAQIANRQRLRCHLSLETPMACGVGICYSCAVAIKTDAGWDYRRVCVDGPVFDAAQLHW
ncbi:MAG: dihydroorotate dehydrogenase electron transfer subunit [Gemmataceae bacterium]|nr:dihydroorotate dehydrogenase electron transfer subunit [Gemmataceae bacterium]